MIICSTCGAENRASASVCRMCSRPLKEERNLQPGHLDDSHLEAATMVGKKPDPARSASSDTRCPKCLQLISVESQYCHRCGSPIPAEQTLTMTSAKPARPRLILVVDGEQTGDAYTLECDTVIGRKAGDIVFPHDDYMSGRHARIAKRGNGFFLSDEGSRNGTFVRIDREVELKPGDMLLVGKQLFKFEL
jgi:hypothetical protein